MKERYTKKGNLITPNFRPSEAPSALEKHKKVDGDSLILKYGEQRDKAARQLGRLEGMLDSSEYNSAVTPGELKGLIDRFRDMLVVGDNSFRAYVEARATNGDEHESAPRLIWSCTRHGLLSRI